MLNHQGAAQSSLTNEYLAKAQEPGQSALGHSQATYDTATSPPSIQSQLSTLEGYVSQLGEMCGRASAIADQLRGAVPTTGSGKACPKSVPNGIIDRMGDVTLEFRDALNFLEQSLQRIGDAL